MQFSGKDIEKQCNRMRLLQGKALYASKKVEEFTVMQDIPLLKDWLNANGYDDVIERLPTSDNQTLFVLKGKVLGSEQPVYDTHVIIDDSAEEKIIKASCTCADYAAGTKFCKHCVALSHNYVVQSLEEKMADRLVKPEDLSADASAKKASNKDGEENVVVTAMGQRIESGTYVSVNDRQGRKSSEAVIQLIQSYSGVQTAMLQSSLEADEQTVVPGTVELVPQLVERGFGNWFLDFRIGTSKKYVVKDVYEFYHNLVKEQFHSYGKNLEFVHKREYFTEESQYFLDLIIDIVGMKLDETVEMNVVRYLPVSGGYLERLLDNQKGKTIIVNDFKYDVKESDPKIPLRVEKVEYGCTLTIPNISRIYGHRRVFLVVPKNNTIYATSQGFSKNMLPVLETFQKYRDWTYMTSYAKALNTTVYLNRRDYVSFCGHVLKKIERYIDLREVNVELGEYMPADCEFHIYLDAPTDTTITCKIKVRYGSKEYTAADWIGGVVHEFRDLEQERDVYVAAKKYFPMENRMAAGKDYFLYCEKEEEIYDLLQYGLKELEEYGTMYVSDSIRKMNIRQSPKVTAGVQIKGSLLELNVSIPDMSNEEITSILAAYRLKKRYFRMKNGDFIELAEDGLGIISDMNKGLGLTEEDWEDGTVEVPIYRANFVDAMMKERGKDLNVVRSKEFRSIIRNMKEIEDSDYEIPANIKATLRSYQKNGYRWLRTLSNYRFGGILADDMGLGKTLQVLTMLQAAMLEENYDRANETALIVCPASLIYNWESECRKFAPDIRTRVIVGGVTERKDLFADLSMADLVITSYDLLKRDIKLYEEKTFSYMIIDEAQYIKNATTQVSRTVKKINAKQRFALTGTPVENRLSDLWSIFDFVMPGYLYSYEHFRKNYEIPVVADKDKGVLARLQKLVTPFILRRRKKDVLKDLPDKIENVIYMNMTTEQKEYYNARFLQLRQNLTARTPEQFVQGKLQVLAELTRLRQLCCDPQLFVEGYKGGSGKVDGFLSMVEELVDNGSNILVFSQFATMLEILQSELEKKDIKTLLLTGKNSKEERRNMVDEFQESQSCVFLISLKAGGTGLNLTAADTVIHFDPWWNIAAQNQATDRAHRIGQKKVVTVMQLVMKNSIEERIIELQERKRELVENVIEGDNINNASLTKEEIMALLEEFE